MALPDATQQELLRTVPHLRAFAISLSGSIDRADDLVQETLLRALANIDRFQPGTCLQAWLFTILRNLFHTEFRRRRREVEDPEGTMAGQLAVLPNQPGSVAFDELRRALAKLPHEQREALLLVSAQGFSYEEAAQITGTQLGTIKSRVNRARARLAELLHVHHAEDLGPDRLVRAVMHGADLRG
jgi:RNA polymerase sigma-70 factor (ECF subfamily)